jgi:signal-transduction protein with cAMP-binding, CBS, and nucleotidyltransferase domain
VAGVITDRDIWVALGTRDRVASDVTVGEVSSKPPVTCRPDDEVRVALKIMCRERIRRLPVLNRSGQLQGILSVNDLLLRAQHWDGANRPGVSYEDVVNTLVAIGLHHVKPKKLLRVAA